MKKQKRQTPQAIYQQAGFKGRKRKSKPMFEDQETVRKK